MIARLASDPTALFIAGATAGIWIIAILMLVVYLVQRWAMRRVYGG